MSFQKRGLQYLVTRLDFFVVVFFVVAVVCHVVSFKVRTSCGLVGIRESGQEEILRSVLK